VRTCASSSQTLVKFQWLQVPNDSLRPKCYGSIILKYRFGYM